MKDNFFEKPKEGQPWDVIIIGSGPSSLTAAIYTTRGAASTLIIAGNTWGGQLMLTTEVDNFPGFPEGIMGPELMTNMKKQAERFGAEIKYENAISIDINNKPFKVKTNSGEYLANSLIIGTGAETLWLGVEGEDKLRGRGVSSCAPCDAPFFKDKSVIVVGGGDSAMEEAQYLTKYAREVTIIHRRDAFRASAAMQKKIFENEKIKVIWDTSVNKMLGEQKLESLELKTAINSEQTQNVKNEVGRDEEFVYWNLAAEGLFVAVGHKPSTDIFSGLIELDTKGYIVKKQDDAFKMSTSVEGVFVAGDVHDTHYKQAITAAGFGCMAAMETLKYLDKEPPTY